MFWHWQCVAEVIFSTTCENRSFGLANIFEAIILRLLQRCVPIPLGQEAASLRPPLLFFTHQRMIERKIHVVNLSQFKRGPICRYALSQIPLECQCRKSKKEQEASHIRYRSY